MKKKEILKTIITIIVSVVLSSGISVYATSTYLYDSCDVSYDNTSSGLNASNVQSSLDELYMHATDYTSIDSRVTSLETNLPNVSAKADLIENINISDITWIPSDNISLFNMTGSNIRSQVGFKYVGNNMILMGRVVVDVTSRTSSNPGVIYTLPNSKKIRKTFDMIVGPTTYKDNSRGAEATGVRGNAGESTFRIYSTETFSNVAGNKTIVFYIPMTIIPIQ